MRRCESTEELLYSDEEEPRPKRRRMQTPYGYYDGEPIIAPESPPRWEESKRDPEDDWDWEDKLAMAELE